MSQHLLIILLTSGLVAFCSCGNYEYYLVDENMFWEEAQTFCRDNFIDLATISNTEDMEQVKDLVQASNVNSEMWIGLRETGPASWLWSTSTSQGVVNYNNWATAPASTHCCGGMRNDGKWLSAPCGSALPFVCKGEGTYELHVVLQNSTWRQAQDYCRQHHLDLASAENNEQNQAVKKKIDQSELVWMGLFRDKWTWSDQSNVSYRYWLANQPNNDGECTLYNSLRKAWLDRDCTYMIPFLCYTITESQSMPQATPQQTERTVRMKIESHSLIDLNDPTVSEAILTQLQSKLEGVKLWWRVQPDGKIFHKEEESDCSSSNNAP